MVSAQGLTRTQMAAQIASNVLGADFVASSPTLAGTALTLIDQKSLTGGNQDHRGKWLWYTPSGAAPQETRVAGFEASSHRLDLFPALSVSTATTGAYELLGDRLSRTMINNAINQAIDEAVGHVYPTETSFGLAADGVTLRYDLPSEIRLLQQVHYRTGVTGKVVHLCDALFDETTDGDFTQSLQSEDKKQGSYSLRLVIAAGASANDKVTDSISSLDLSGMTHIEMWIKCTVAAAAAHLHLLLDDTAGCASPLETLEVPALTADTWTYVRLALANPELDTAIISVGLRYTTDTGAETVWIDGINAVNHDTADWEPLALQLYRVDRAARDLVLSEAGRAVAGQSLLKLTGGSHPTRMTSDDAVADIPEGFIVARATALLLMGGSQGSRADPSELRTLASYWAGRADQAKASFPPVWGKRA